MRSFVFYYTFYKFTIDRLCGVQNVRAVVRIVLSTTVVIHDYDCLMDLINVMSNLY